MGTWIPGITKETRALNALATAVGGRKSSWFFSSVDCRDTAQTFAITSEWKDLEVLSFKNHGEGKSFCVIGFATILGDGNNDFHVRIVRDTTQVAKVVIPGPETGDFLTYTPVFMANVDTPPASASSISYKLQVRDSDAGGSSPTWTTKGLIALRGWA